MQIFQHEYTDIPIKKYLGYTFKDTRIHGQQTYTDTVIYTLVLMCAWIYMYTNHANMSALKLCILTHAQMKQ